MGAKICNIPEPFYTIVYTRDKGLVSRRRSFDSSGAQWLQIASHQLESLANASRGVEVSTGVH
jgi:hypothetical protein